MDNENQTGPLKYFLFKKRQWILLNLIGSLVKPNQSVLEMCLAELSQHEVQWTIMNFQSVSQIDDFGVAFLNQLRNLEGGQPRTLKVCAIQPSHLERLLKAGVIAPNDTGHDLSDVLRTLSFVPIKFLDPAQSKKVA